MDMAQGYGGKYGVQTDRKDKSALGWDEKVELAQHESQKGFLNYILLVFFSCSTRFFRNLISVLCVLEYIAMVLSYATLSQITFSLVTKKGSCSILLQVFDVIWNFVEVK